MSDEANHTSGGTPSAVAAPQRRRSLAALVALNTTLLTAGRLLTSLVGLVGVAIATRYLGRDAFGQLTVALGFVALFQSLPDLGLWTITAREIARRPEDRDRLLSNAFTIGALLSLLTLGVTIGLMTLLYGAAGDELVRRGVLILSVQLVFSAPAGAASAVLTAEQRAAPIAVAGVAASLTFLAIVPLVLALDWGFTGIAADYAAAGIVNALLPLLAVRRGGGLRMARDGALWGQLIRWALPQGAVLVLSLLYFRIDTVLLSLLSTDAEVALYGVGYKLNEVLVLLPLYFMVTLFPELARAQNALERIAALGQAAVSSLTLGALAVMVLCVPLAPEIVAVIGGSEEFDGAVPVVRLLAVAVALVFVTTYFFHALVALNRQRELVILIVVVLAVNVALNAALIPSLGAEGAALALILSEMASLVMVAAAYARLAALPRVAKPVRLAAAGLLGAGAAWAATAIPAPDWLVLLVAGGIACVVYVAGLRLLSAVPPELERSLAALGAGLRSRTTE
jgi:O-antigen/teichoic acid export membrane protein